VEVTKWLKPSISVSRIGDSANVQAATRETGKQYVVQVHQDEGLGAARLVVILAGENPANRGVQSLL
jgi:hypothetical protein